MTTVRIAQLTDIHVPEWSGLRRRDLFGKRVTGLVNHRLRRSGEHGIEVLRAAVRRLVEERPDHVIVSGDLTNVGTRAELEAARRELAPLADAGIPLSVIPGNHDYYVRECTRGAFEEVFADWIPRPEAGAPPYPFVVRVDRVSLLHFNSALPTGPLMAWGRIGAAQLARADALAARETALGQTLVLVSHHHPTRAPHRKVEWTRNLRDAADLRALALRHHATLLLHGHNHTLHLRHIGTPDGPLVVGLSSSSSLRLDRDDRRGRAARYTFRDGTLSELATCAWSPEARAFGPWSPIDAAAVPVESPRESRGLDRPAATSATSSH